MLIREGHAGYIIGKSGARIKELRMVGSCWRFPVFAQLDTRSLFCRVTSEPACFVQALDFKRVVFLPLLVWRTCLSACG